MAYEVEFTSEFEGWWDTLTQAEQESVDFPFGCWKSKVFTCDGLMQTPFTGLHTRTCELRVQHHGHPYRILYAFDPRRTAMLLLGGDKTGYAAWYEEFVPRADAIYAQHLREIGSDT